MDAPMSCACKTAFPLFAAALLSTAAAAPAPVLRFTSAPLTRSVRNEADAAIDRARDWLAARQSPDGSWNGDARTTAICLLALADDETAVGQRQAGSAIGRALDWLEACPDSRDSSRAPSASWPRIALAVFGRLPPSDLPELPPCPDSGATEAERAFWFAHAVNRALRGELPASAGTPDGWRAPLAARWTTTQQIDEHGRGHWRSSVPDTAFAILLLKEL